MGIGHREGTQWGNTDEIRRDFRKRCIGYKQEFVVVVIDLDRYEKIWICMWIPSSIQIYVLQNETFEKIV